MYRCIFEKVIRSEKGQEDQLVFLMIVDTVEELHFFFR